jgi:hypothetical protein
LYAEQFSGTAFTAPRTANKRTWTYRIRPSVLHKPFRQFDAKLFVSSPFDEIPTTPNQLRWDPLPMPDAPTDFLDGLVTFAGNSVGAVHLYAANRSMKDRFFYDADGELLFVPERGRLLLRTERCLLELAPGENERKGTFALPDGGTLAVRGRADRVDELPDGTLRVVDYKTGRAGRFAKDPKGGAFNGGRQLQPAIYAAGNGKVRFRDFKYRALDY